MSENNLPTETEFDFSKDSVVDTLEAVFTITEAEEKETDSSNGKGTQHVLTFESDDFPYPIVLRQFVAYTPTDAGKDTSWVNRSRGVLKNIAKAAMGITGYSLNPNSPHYLVGKQVRATTKDNGEGFATLGKFRKVENGGL